MDGILGVTATALVSGSWAHSVLMTSSQWYIARIHRLRKLSEIFVRNGAQLDLHTCHGAASSEALNFSQSSLGVHGETNELQGSKGK